MSHETLANKIEEDVERPLREYSSKNRDMQSMSGIQSNLAGLAKNVETAQKKVDKAKGKGTKGADKLASAVTEADEINQQWESRAPFVYEQLQAADEGRLNHLRDVLTQLETHEVDQVERGRQAAESCLNVLLNVETADEIKTFAAKHTGNRMPLSPVQSRRQPSQAETPPIAPATPAAVSTPLTEPLEPPRIQDDAASQRSEIMQSPAPRAETPVAIQTPPGKPLDGSTSPSNVTNVSLLSHCSSRSPAQEHPFGWLETTRHCYEPSQECDWAIGRKL